MSEAQQQKRVQLVADQGLDGVRGEELRLLFFLFGLPLPAELAARISWTKMRSESRLP